MYCYVIGANPPTTIMEDFVRSICKSYGIYKVAMVKPCFFFCGESHNYGEERFDFGELCYVFL